MANRYVPFEQPKPINANDAINGYVKMARNDQFCYCCFSLKCTTISKIDIRYVYLVNVKKKLYQGKYNGT